MARSKKADKMTYKPTARFPEEYKDKIAELAKSFKAKVSDILRMGVDRLWSEYESGPEVERGFTGPPELVSAKMQIIMAYRDHKGEAMAAREIGTTSQEVRKWRATDEFFDLMCKESRMESLERVEHALWTNGVQRRESKACFGILNAKSEDYGLIKKGYADRELVKVVKEKFYPILVRNLSRQTLDTVLREFAAEFGGGNTPDTPKLTG